MQRDELIEAVAYELTALQTSVGEIEALLADVEAEPTIREKTAAGAFLAQFYTGVENILKRFARFHRVSLPHGDTWHLDLFLQFCKPVVPGFPALFDETLASDLGPYRRFRHVVYHGYGFDLEWERMEEGMRQVPDVFERFKLRLKVYLDHIP